MSQSTYDRPDQPYPHDYEDTRTDLGLFAEPERGPSVRVRGAGSHAGAKVISVPLALASTLLGVLGAAMTAAGLSGQAAGREDGPEILMIGLGTLVGGVLLLAAVTRLASFGTALLGLAGLALTGVLILKPAAAAGPIGRLDGALPNLVSGLQLAVVLTNPLSVALLSSLLLGMAFAASLTRRAPRRYQPPVR